VGASGHGVWVLVDYEGENGHGVWVLVDYKGENLVIDVYCVESSVEPCVRIKYTSCWKDGALRGPSLWMELGGVDSTT